MRYRASCRLANGTASDTTHHLNLTCRFLPNSGTKYGCQLHARNNAQQSQNLVWPSLHLVFGALVKSTKNL